MFLWRNKLSLITKYPPYLSHGSLPGLRQASLLPLAVGLGSQVDILSLIQTHNKQVLLQVRTSSELI